jgi:archaellum biogenesis ATPase FlaH
MSYESLFKLRTNPFRLTPALDPQEVIWAGFPDIKEKFKNRIAKAIKVPNSSLVLNWGEYGSGKTHAARYFSKKGVLEEISSELSKGAPYPIVFSLPKGKEPIYNLFATVIDKLRISELRGRISSLKIPIEGIVDNYTDNNHYRNVLKCIFSEANENLVRKYLYGSLNSSEFKELDRFQILRHLDTDGDYTKILAGILTCLTADSRMYSCFIIWIDEFEEIASLSNSSIEKVNSFLRELLDSTPNNLLVFLNFTQSSLIDEEDLGQYLNESVRSRIKERINFDLPTKEDIILYLKDLLKYYRSEEVNQDLFPFEVSSIESVVSKLGNVSLRRFNEAFSILLEYGDIEGVSPIKEDFVEKHSTEIVGWK